MTLPEKIKTIYPEITDDQMSPFKADQVIWLRDDSDGNGPYIEKWEHPTLPKPTKEQLEG
jgi:hypothetical protein